MPDALSSLAAEDLVEEVVVIAPERELRIVRPRDAEALIDEEAFAREERLPYWAELWPSGVALARAVAPRALRGARVLELGCGLGTASVAASLAGGRVLATDWAEEALEFTQLNAERNGTRVATLRADWHASDALVARGPWDLVLAADVLYERRNLPVLDALLPRLVAPRGAVWLADPGRKFAAEFLVAARARWRVETRGTVHRLTPRS